MSIEKKEGAPRDLQHAEKNLKITSSSPHPDGKPVFFFFARTVSAAEYSPLFLHGLNATTTNHTTHSLLKMAYLTQRWRLFVVILIGYSQNDALQKQLSYS